MAVPIVDRLPQPDDHARSKGLDAPPDAGPTSLRRQAARRALNDPQWVRCTSCGMEVRAEQLLRHRDSQH